MVGDVVGWVYVDDAVCLQLSLAIDLIKGKR